MLKIILALLAIMTTMYVVTYAKDFMKHKEGQNKKTIKKGLLVGFVTDFFDAIGVGSFATTTAYFKMDKSIEIPDRVIPGTLNVAHALPMIVQAFMSLTVIEVDTMTLVSMIISAVIGSFIGAGIISKLPEKVVQLTMGVALLATAVLIILGQLNLMPSGGNAMALENTKLILGIVGNFILGALMTVGIGLYAPCMAMVALLGMNPQAAFPIMMGACAFIGPIASYKFIKEGAYKRDISVGITLGGVVGSMVALLFVTNIPTYWLKWIVAGVVVYTGATMLKQGMNKKNKELSPENIA